MPPRQRRSLLSLGASASARTPGGAAALSLAPAGDAAIRMAFVSAALSCVAGGDAAALGDMLLGGVGADDPIADGADAPTLAGFAADMGAPEGVLAVLARGGAAPGDAGGGGAAATHGTPDAGVAAGGTALPRVAYLQLKLEEKDELIAALKSSIVELSTVAGELRAVATSAGTVKVVDHVRELRAKLAAAALEAAAKDEEMASLHRRVEAWRAKAESLAEFRRTATATAAAAAAPLQQAAAPDAEEPGSRRRIPRRERVGVLMDTRRGAPVAETPSEVAARAARDAPAPAAAPDDASSKRPKRLTRRERVAGLMGERRNTEPLPARPAPPAPSSLSPPPSPHVVSVDGMTGELVVSPPGKPRAIEPVSHWEIGNGAPTVPELHGLLHV